MLQNKISNEVICFVLRPGWTQQRIVARGWGEGIRDCCVSAACTCAFWACNKHAGDVDLVSATTEITVHSIETVSGGGAWQTSAARLSLHADIALLQSFSLGRSDNSLCTLRCRFVDTWEGEWWKTRDTRTHTDIHTRWQCLWLLTSQIPWIWPRARKGVRFRAFLIEDSTWRLPWWTVCMVLISHRLPWSTKPQHTETEAIRALCWMGRMSRRKHHSEISPLQRSYSAIVQGKMIL